MIDQEETKAAKFLRRLVRTRPPWAAQGVAAVPTSIGSVLNDPVFTGRPLHGLPHAQTTSTSLARRGGNGDACVVPGCQGGRLGPAGAFRIRGSCALRARGRRPARSPDEGGFVAFFVFFFGGPGLRGHATQVARGPSCGRVGFPGHGPSSSTGRRGPRAGRRAALLKGLRGTREGNRDSRHVADRGGRTSDPRPSGKLKEPRAGFCTSVRSPAGCRPQAANKGRGSSPAGPDPASTGGGSFTCAACRLGTADRVARLGRGVRQKTPLLRSDRAVTAPRPRCALPLRPDYDWGLLPTIQVRSGAVLLGAYLVLPWRSTRWDVPWDLESRSGTARGWSIGWARRGGQGGAGVGAAGRSFS